MTTTTVDRNMMSTYRRWPVEFVAGSSCTLYDAAGAEYLDLVAGLAVASVGHGHPRVVAAVRDQIERLTHVSNLYVTRPQQDLADRLASLTGGMHSFFCNSGAEAVECAVKLARKHGGTTKRRIVAFDGGFHGRTLGALSVTGQPAKRHAFEPLVPQIEHVPYNDVPALEAALSDHVAAVLVEPIQGEAGVVVPSPDFLAQVRALCDGVGALLIADEVQTGVGRTGMWFASEHFDVAPDVMCLAKGLGGGLPIGACLAVPHVAASFGAGDHATTFGGGPVSCAAALAVLDTIEEQDLVANAARVGASIMEQLREVGDVVADVRGYGLLIGVELHSEVARDVAALALERRVLVNDATPSVVRVCPPLLITDAEARDGIDVLMSCIREVCA